MTEKTYDNYSVEARQLDEAVSQAAGEEPHGQRSTRQYIGSGLYAEFDTDGILRIGTRSDGSDCFYLSTNGIDALLAYIAEART